MVLLAVALSVREAFPWTRLLRMCAFGLLVFAACLQFVPDIISAQEKNPYAGDAKAAKLGESQFRINCAFCHGLGARGGGRGPDLTRVKKNTAARTAISIHTINEGVPGTAMPANGTTGQGVGMTAEEIWEVVTYIRSVEKKTRDRRCGEGRCAVSRGGGLRNVPHSQRKRRAARTGFDVDWRGAFAGFADGVGAQSEPAPGVGID